LEIHFWIHRAEIKALSKDTSVCDGCGHSGQQVGFKVFISLEITISEQRWVADLFWPISAAMVAYGH
jgi:hypothetical protein